MTKQELVQSIKESLKGKKNIDAFINDLNSKGISTWLAHNPENDNILGISYSVIDNNNSKIILLGKDDLGIGFKAIINAMGKEQLSKKLIDSDYLLNKVKKKEEFSFVQGEAKDFSIKRDKKTPALPENFEFPKKLMNVSLTDEIKDQLLTGEWSEVLTGFETEEGDIKSGRLKLVQNENGEYEIKVRYRQMELEIPDEMFGHTLTDVEKAELESGLTVGPFNYDKAELYLKVDKELNRVTVSTSGDFNLPKSNQIGGYELTDLDKNNLVNGNSIGMRVFKGDNGYFKANIKIEQKFGHTLMHFDSAEALSNKQAQELIPKLNKVNHSLLSEIGSVSSELSSTKEIEHSIERSEEVLKNAEIDIEESVTLSQTNDIELIKAEESILSPQQTKFELEVLEAIEREDFKTLNGLLAKGKDNDLSPSTMLKQKVVSSGKLPNKSKITALVLLGVSEPAKLLHEKKENKKSNSKEDKLSAKISKESPAKGIDSKKVKQKLKSGTAKAKQLLTDIG